MIRHTRVLAALLATLSLLPIASASQDEGPPEAPRGRLVIKGRAPVAEKLLRVRLPRPDFETLPNGLRLLVLRDRRLPSVRISLGIPAGSLFEERAGVADLTATMLEEGTRTRAATAIAEEVEELGARLSTVAGIEWASVTASGLASGAPKLVELLADVALRPAFPDDRFARVRARTAASLAARRADPAFLAQQVAAEVIYGRTPFAGLAPAPGEVRSITRDELARFHERRYRPDGAILALSGDVRPELLDRARQLFGPGGWPAAGAKPAIPAESAGGHGDARIFLVDRPGSVQTYLRFVSRGIARSDPDYAALAVANRILGGGMTARLGQNLREDKGYTYGASSALSTPRWRGTWSATASVRTEVTEPAVREFLHEFRRIRDEPVTADELARAKRAIIGRFALTVESAEGVMDRMLELVQYGLPLGYWDAYPAKIEAVTTEDVLRISRTYLAESDVRLVAVGDRARIEEGLRRHGTVVIQSP